MNSGCLVGGRLGPVNGVGFDDPDSCREVGEVMLREEAE